MENKFIIIIFACAVFALCVFIIFMGCNSAQPEFDFTKNKTGADSIPEKCAVYPDQMRPGSFVTPYEKCISRAEYKENMCADYFWWLRY